MFPIPLVYYVLSSFFFFFLMIRGPPRSTPFPTRRSSDLRGRCRRQGQGGRGAVQEAWRDRRRNLGDRKSTRMNSSHVEISYAVFCLHSKENRTTTSREPTQAAMSTCFLSVANKL